MKSKEEIKTWLLENATNKEGQIDISNIDFGDKEVILEEIKADKISNEGQEATLFINNKCQKAYHIYNEFQKAGEIFNGYQGANGIYNREQEAQDYISNLKQEAGIIIGNKKEWEVKE